MKPLAIIQARGSSTRLPMKIYKDIYGTCMLDRIEQRVRQTGWDVWLGLAEIYPNVPTNDVLARFQLIANRFPTHDPIVRITADCPLWDSEIGLAILSRYQGEYTSTTPMWDGLDVQIIPRDLLFHNILSTPEDREHLLFGLHYRTQDIGLPMRLDWSIDTQDDLDWVRRVIAACPHCDAGVPWHSNSLSSIGRIDDRIPVFDLHHLSDGGLGECQAYDILMERVTRYKTLEEVIQSYLKGKPIDKRGSPRPTH